MRIIYMGTPDFAVAPLRTLLENGHQVVAVVTMPDKAIGRHHDVLQSSPVKQFAVEHGLPVLQPEKLKDPAFLEELRSYEADLQVVVAFRMLPEVVWAMPRLGTFNLHAALLPQYRGAAPLNWAVINGEKETGVTTFFLDHDIDTGRIIMQERCPISETDNVGDVHDRLMELGSQLVLRTVRAIEDGTAKSVPQEQFMADEPLRHAPKIFKETCRIDWQAGLNSTYNFVRGLSPYPAAWTTLVEEGEGAQAEGVQAEDAQAKGMQAGDAQAKGTQAAKSLDVKIFATHREPADHNEQPGTLRLSTSELAVATPGGWLCIDELQVAGKKRMKTADFLRGARFGTKMRFV